MRNANTNSYGNSDSHHNANADSDSNPNGNTHTNAYSNSNPDGHRDAYIFIKAFNYTAASSDAATSPIAQKKR